jgi:hypothetical protein
MPLMRLTTIAAAPLRDEELLAGETRGGPPTSEASGSNSGMAASPPATADTRWVIASYGAVIAGAVAAILLWKWRNPASFAPGTGISVFAPLYILAQAIERVIEPLTKYVSAKAPDAGKDSAARPMAKGTPVRKNDAIHNVNQALVAGDAQQAADWQGAVDEIRKNTSVIAWTLASVLGMVLCGLFGLFMLRLVGLSGVPKWVDIVITGIAVGSGTGPLHDLITNVQTAKEQKQDPSEKKAA